MKKWLFLLAPLLLGIAEPKTDITSPFERCRTGIRGWGLDLATGLYDATCGNFNWSGDAEYLDCACTVDVNEGPDNCTATDAATGDPYAGPEVAACLYDGERIKATAAMADLAIAVDKLKEHGTTYLPNFRGKNHGIYLMEGCGDNFNGDPLLCPLVRQRWDEADRVERTYNAGQRTRTVQVTGARRVVGEGGPGAQAIDPRRSPRRGTFWITDTGKKDVGTDRNGDGTVIAITSMVAGLFAGGNLCTPNPNGTCDYDASGANAVGAAAGTWARTWNVIEDLAVNDQAQTICFDNTEATTGTCRGDRRKLCDEDSDCNFTGGGGPDDGPCEGTGDALDYEVDNQGLDQQFACRIINNPVEGGAGAGGQTPFGPFRVISVDEGSTCGAGGAGYDVELEFVNPEAGPFENEGTWFFSDPDIDYSAASRVQCFPIGPDYYATTPVNQAFYNWSSVSTMPSSWFGRTSANAAYSCESNGDADTVDDEAACDSAPQIGLAGGFGGGFVDYAVYLGSTLGKGTVDGNSLGIQTALHDSLISDVVRGLAVDASRWSIERVHFRDIYALTGDSDFAGFDTVISIFSGQTHWKDLTCTRCQADAFARVEWSRGNRITNAQLLNSFFFYGWVRDKGGSFNSFEGFRGEGNTGPLYTCVPQNGGVCRYVLIRDWVALAQSSGQQTEGAVGYARGLFIFTDSSSGGNDTRYRDIVIDRVHAEVVQSDACLVWVSSEDDQGNPDKPTDYMNEITVKESSIVSANSKIICADQWNQGPGISTAANEEGALDPANGFPVPRLVSNRADDKIQANVSPASEAAANTQNGNGLPLGAFYRIHDDTAVGDCTDAGMDGKLDGGGSAVSLCIWDGTQWISAI